VYEAMNDDFNTPIALSAMFEGVRIINSVYHKKETITADQRVALQKLFTDFVFGVFGLQAEQAASNNKVDELMQVILEVRNDVKAKKDFATSDMIRDRLKAIGFEIKDGKEGTSYSIIN
jgi:cysteinyl-tRNA synthetase